LKKSMKLWMVLAIVVLLAVAVPSLVFLPGCNIRDDDSSTTDINKGTVVGTVTDAGTGSGIENVTVTIVEQSAKAVISDETDADGMYNLPNVAPGTQTITAKKSGYANYSTTVEVIANITVTQDISLNAVIASTVSGSVKNSTDDSPIVGAKVWIDDLQDYSNSTGNYELNGVSAGTVVLRATLSSYVDYQITMVIEEGTTVTQNVDMDEDNTPPAPAEGKSNIYGRVTAAYKPVSNATVNLFALDAKNDKQASPTPSPSPTPAATTKTDNDGTYQFLGVAPGNYRVEVVKSGYDTKTETIEAKDGENSRVDTVSLAGGPSPSPSVSPSVSPSESPAPGQISTTLVSARESGAAPTQNTINSINGVADDTGKIVVFQSNDHLLATHITATTQIYKFDNSKGSLTLVSMKGSTLGDGNSINPCISPDGKYVAFASKANNLLDTPDAEGKQDIMLYKISGGTITRLSTQPANKNVGGNGDSDNPSLSNNNADGFYCAYDTLADDVIAPIETVKNKNVYRTKIGTDDKAESIILVSRQRNAGNVSGGNADSGNPHINEDGKFVAYESLASDLVDGVNPGVNTQIFRYNANNDLENRNSVVSSDNGTLAPAAASNPCVSNDGKYVSYQVAASAWGHAGKADCFRRNMSGTGNELVSGMASGTIGDSQNPTMTSDGAYVAFESNTKSFGDQNNGDGTFNCYVRNMGKEQNETVAYTCVSVGGGNPGTTAEYTSGINSGSRKPYITRSGNHVVFHSSATNLVTGSTIGTDNYNVYIRKWK